jgi:predicted nucleotidyltransferase component of viral defense system
VKDTIYYKQVHLLIRILPIIHREKSLALKGGTVINLFIRNIPRLSVDIDLVYLPIEDRETSLKNISDALNRIKEHIRSILSNTFIVMKKISGTNNTYGLTIQENDVLIKIKVNTIIRGSVYSPVELSLSPEASKLFEMYATIQSLSFEEVFAGKICAALDRQHPRDLFDIKILLENEGITNKLMKAFLIYLISSNRPIVELLNPNSIDITDVFNKEFAGLTSESISLEDLFKTRQKLITSIHSSLSSDYIKFLLSFKKKEPRWELINIENVNDLPAINWKLMNLERMDADKYKAAYNKLEKFLLSLEK